MARIVTTTYRYKPPPRRKGRKLAEITGPAVVTSVDPKRGSRRRDNQGGGQKATAAGQSTRLERADQQQPSTAPERQRDPVVTTAGKAPASANDDREPAPLTVRGRCRAPDTATAGDAALSSAAPASESDHSVTMKRSAIITVPARKTAQRQRKQQQMVKLMATEAVSPETKDLVDRMMLGRWPGSAPPKKP